MPLKPDEEFVELHRTFHELSEHAGKSDDIDLSQVFHVRSNLTWDDLLKHPRTVILSEAGSGKTQEIRNAASRLRAGGHAAFFLRLELIADDFDIAFEVGTSDQFKAWLASDESGWLLLDSVDEARLGSPKDFEKAIRKLGKLLEAAKGRVTIILTGRTHAWRPKTDFDLCEKHIGFPPGLRSSSDDANPSAVKPESDDLEGLDDPIETEQRPESSDPQFKVVALDDLSKEQVTAFADAKGVIDVSQFMDEIERVDAWTSTTRPQDLEDVVALWNDTGRIGTRREIMENSVSRRLTERDQERAEVRPLSDDRARQGVMLMAAATTLAQTQIIRVPDGANNTKGLPPKSILAIWTDGDIGTLLSRPIFDNAIYGTVRFHHRSVREYLTAVWLAKLLERHASRRSIEDLLFKNQYGVDVIVPLMRPILPWLAIFDERVRNRVRKIAPEDIFEGGDPSALPLPTRQEILAEVCEHMAHDKILHSATEYAAVQRFAQQDIAKDIGILIKQYASNDTVVGFLLRMIWLGRLSSLLPEAKKIALSANASRYTRIAAFRAVREVGTHSDLEDVRNALLNETPKQSREWIGELATELPASPKEVAWLLSAIEKSEDKERYSVDRFEDAATAFVDHAPLEMLPPLLAGLNQLLDRPPFIERGYCEVSKQFSWLLKPAAHAAERLMQVRDAHALHPHTLSVLYKFRAAREWGEDYKDIKVEFAKLVPEWPELNNASFWHDIATAREVAARKKGERLTDFWRTQIFGAFWKFSSTDFEDTLSWISSRPDQDDKLVALTLSFAVYSENGKLRGWREKLKRAVEGNSELETRLEQLFNPPPADTEYRKMERKWKRQAAARAKRESERFAKDKEHVQTHLDAIRDPKLSNPADVSRAQWYLHEKLRDKGGSTNKWTDGRWRDLTPIFGQPVADAYRDGAMAYWRRYKPKLRSEGAQANQTTIMTIFGLTGLAIEAREVAGGLQTLNQSEAELVTRYALCELNGFPEWFPKFYPAHRERVREVIFKEIEFEVGAGVRDQDTHYILSDVSWSGEWMWNDLAPSLYMMVAKSEPKNDSHLHQLLKIIQGSSILDADLARLASEKVAKGNAEHLADWFAVWAGVAPDVAISALARHLASITNDAENADFAMRFVTKLWGGRRSDTFGARDAFQTPQHLKELYILMHRHIRVSDDIDRVGGGVYSPGLRDNAQEGRNRILQVLNKIPGKEAFLALRDIAALSRQTQSYSYLEMLTRQKAEQDADLKPWTPANVREFNERLDRTPSTHRELADLAVLRLLDLKDDLENGDDSVAAIVKSVSEETVLRNYIGHTLREKAFGRYSIPQEEELADAKKPDLRFHAPAIDAPVPVELKIADKWTGPKLFERLENQLAGDYLRDVRSARGIFALVYRGVEKAGWDLPGSGQRVDFEGLVKALRQHWLQLAPKFPGIDEMTVIGIDLSKRGK